ncbi:MAG: hypothetical protein JNJ89_14485 [Rubrivivax sp.]|nr:hypothetical protein [Rubrivivax sp.]
MSAGPPDLAQVRLDNALLLFEEFVRATARHADAAALRGLERRFAERVQVQPSYWSQIKSRSRQIGERLARQFEHLMHKPRGWMDQPHTLGAGSEATVRAAGGLLGHGGTAGGMGLAGSEEGRDDRDPRDEDERFIVGLVLTYYRRHPQRARTSLLGLLGEVLVPTADAAATAPRVESGGASAVGVPEDPGSLWQQAQRGVAPLKRKR